MISLRTFSVKTKQGKVLKIVREHYLRSDIPCSSAICEECDQELCKLESEGKSKSTLIPTFHYIVPDTNVILHQVILDVLEDPVFKNVVVPQTVVEEVKHRHTPTYVRLRTLIDQPDRHFYVFTNEHHK
ncbi:DIS3 [Cordylochernes scorpioides]|uniref:DIS3 n=1 Tax=Cordylochernes scorpioides TaxID=51811 RepID=A0ABY6LIP6_9ARAC|nr:DIS3 [Cordylochernes scorpioides]